MFNRDRNQWTTDRPVAARGGVSGGAVLTGVVVAFGAMFLLSALIGGIIAALGIAEEEIARGEAIDAGIAAGMALVVAQFVSYLWGGYAAGRMGRGAGLANGLLVPLLAIIVAVVVGAIAASLGATANLNLPFTTNRLPLENDFLVNWGTAIGIAALVAMFVGGAVGGTLGQRWHTKLERRIYEEELPESTSRDREGHIDLREDQTETSTRTAHMDAHGTHPAGRAGSTTIR